MSTQKATRRKPVTEENKAESKRLTAIWEQSRHGLTQADFGRLYDIGGQGAVSQFLNGTVALSLKAAQGFAQGLWCSISDFSERLAEEASVLGKAASIAWVNNEVNPVTPLMSWPFKQIDPSRFHALTKRQQVEIQGAVRMMIGMFEEDARQNGRSPS